MFRQKGLSLIELIIGMVVFAIAMVVIISVLAPQARRSVDPIFQIRATELAQSMLNEITAKSFDENSDRRGGHTVCSLSSAPLCTAPAALGPDSESRDRFDDVDDFNGLTVIADSRNNSLADLYAGFSVSVSVFYDADMNGLPDSVSGHHKLITVAVTTPNDDVIQFSSYRSNY